MVISRLNIGGTETYILSMARALRTLGVHVGVATQGGPLLPVCREYQIPVHRLPRDSSPTAIAAALANLAPSRYQIIQLHDSHSFMATEQIRNKCGVPVILTIHGTYHQHKAIIHGARHAQRLVPVSSSILSWVRAKRVKAPLVMIPNGIDTSHFSPSQDRGQDRRRLGLPNNAQIVLHPARFDFLKQAIARKVIQASSQVARRHPLVHLILIGPGPHRSSLHKLAVKANRRLGRAAIEVRPPTMDIRRYHRAADLVIASGRTVMEAMSCAKPVIASGIRGYEGILNANNMEQAIRRGFGDHSGVRPLRVSVLATDMEKLVGKPSSLRALGDHNREVVQRQFAIEVIAGRWLTVYGDLVTVAPVAATETPDDPIISGN